jgi:hypothetical protein
MPSNKEFSPVARSLLVLLNNIDELIVKSNNRSGAKGVMKAFVAYAQGKSYPIPNDKIENFYAILLDGRPETISFIVKDIASDIIYSAVN